LLTQFPGLELLLIESGGDNLAATFSPELVDATIYVIDVAEGEQLTTGKIVVEIEAETQSASQQ